MRLPNPLPFVIILLLPILFCTLSFSQGFSPATLTISNTHPLTDLTPVPPKLFRTLQAQLNSTTIPIGFRGSTDSSGLFTILYYLSESTASTNTSKKTYVLEAMVFRENDFQNGLPSVSNRIPIQKLSVTIRFNNPVQPRTHILSENLLKQGGIDAEVESVQDIPISFGDQTQLSFVLKPLTDFLFILQDFTLPFDIPVSPQSGGTSTTTPIRAPEMLLLFSAVIVPNSQDIVAYRRAISQGAVPASENPFYTTELKINSSNTLSTVTTILIRNMRWIVLNLSTANSLPAYARINTNTTTPILTGAYSVVREQFAELDKVNDIISTLPDQQITTPPKWPVFSVDNGKFYHMVYGYNDFGTNTASLKQNDKKPETFIPSFYAPRQLLPLSGSAINKPTDNNIEGTLVSNAARNTFTRLNNQFSSSTTITAVTLPSNMIISGNTNSTTTVNSINKTLVNLLSSRSNTVAFPIQVRLVPFNLATTQFTIPQYTIGMWPKSGQSFDWVDIQIQVQLVRLSTQLVSDTNPTLSTALDMTDVSHNMGTMGVRADLGGLGDLSMESFGRNDRIVKNDDGMFLVLKMGEVGDDGGNGEGNLGDFFDDNLDINENENYSKNNYRKNPQKNKFLKENFNSTVTSSHKMKLFQSAAPDPNPLDPTIQAPIITPSLSPTVVASDLTQAQLSNLLSRVVHPTTWDRDLPTMRYQMASIVQDSTPSNNNGDLLGENQENDDNPSKPPKKWKNSQTDQLYHFDINLYALRANHSSHNNNVEYAIAVFYQFLSKPTSPSTSPNLLVSDWVPFITKLPTINQTISSNFFPFEQILPNLNVVEFSTTTPSTNPGTETPVSTILPVIPNDNRSTSTPRTTLQPVRLNERVDLATTEAVTGTPSTGNVPIRDPNTSATISTPAVSTGNGNGGTITGNPTTGTVPTTVTTPTTPTNMTNPVNPTAPTTPTSPNTPITVPTNPNPNGGNNSNGNNTNGNNNSTNNNSNTNTNTNTSSNTNTNTNSQRFIPTFPVSPLYSTIGYNVTWFLLKHNPSSPYLFRHDILPASLRSEFLETSLFADSLKNPSKDDFSNNLFVVEAIPSIAIRFIVEVLDVKINIHVNNVYQGSWNMKLLLGDSPEVRFPSGVYNDIDGDGIRDSPALHNTDPQAYIRPFNGERWMSPVLQVHPDDLLSFSFTYQIRPYAKYIPEWANSRDPSYQTQIATTTLYSFAGAKSFVSAILPIETSSPDPAQLISSPAFKYSVKVRTTIPTSKVALSFTVGRISAQDGGLLGLPPIDPGVCFSTSQHLPLRGRHNVWTRLEFMPMSIVPLSPTSAIRDSEGTLQSGFTATLPDDLRRGSGSTSTVQSSTTMTAIINYVLSTLPPLLEDWWYFDGLIESTSSLLTADDYHATFAAALDVVAPFPDPDPGLRLRATPSEELLLYAFVIWPQHNENDVSTSASLIYSPDTYTSSGRAMGFQQCFPLHSVCF